MGKYKTVYMVTKGGQGRIKASGLTDSQVANLKRNLGPTWVQGSWFHWYVAPWTTGWYSNFLGG
jgi:hypothetical protein